MRSVADRHEKALHQWQRWKQARTRREREEAVIELWRFSEPEVVAVIKKLADRLSESVGRPGSITVPIWLSMHGMTYEDARYAAFLAVAEAVKQFDPAKGTFQTYAFPFILGQLYRGTLLADVLAFAGPLHEGSPEGDAPAYEASDGSISFLSRIVGIPAEELAEHVYTQTAALSSEELENAVADFETLCPEPLRSENRSLEIVHGMLIAQATRAAELEGKTVRVSDLAQMLRAKEYRGHMNKRWRSDAQLAREFGIAPNTVKAWLEECKKQAIAADDLSPETLTQLARIMTPQRGFAAGRRRGPQL